MHFSVVNIGTNTGASGTTLAITVGAAGVPAGATIFVLVTEKSTSGTSGTLADTAGNSYSTITAGNLAALAADGRGILFAVTNCKALVNTNTITYTRNLSGAACAMSAFYVSGATGAATFTEGLATATGTTGTITVTSGSLGAGRLVLGALFDSGSSSAGAGATYTQSTGYATPPIEANSSTSVSGNARVDGGTLFKTATGTQVFNPSYSSTAQQWFLAVVGIIPAPDTEQWIDLPPAQMRGSYYDVLLRTTALDLLQTTLAPDQTHQPLPFDYGIPTQPPWRLEQTWTWRQVGMLGKDIVPGDQSFELPPRAAPRLPYYGTEWRQVGMLGKDRLPVGAQVYALTPHRFIAPPIEQTTTWRQVGMLGQDRLPVGDQVTDLAPATPRIVYYRDWALNLLQTTLGAAVQAPFVQTDWPLPRAPAPIDQTWTFNFVLTAPTVAVLPFNQTDWQLPQAPSRIDQTWIWRQVGMLGLDQLPVGQQVYDLTAHRLIAKPIEQTWTWRQVGMLGQDRLPVGAQVTDLTPKPAPRLPYYGTEWRQVGMLGQDRLPVGKIVQELTSHRFIPQPIEQTTAWRQVQMLGLDRLPAGDQVTDLAPRGPLRQVDLANWVSSVNLALVTAAPVPFYQATITSYALPNRGPAQPDRSFAFATPPALIPPPPVVTGLPHNLYFLADVGRLKAF